MIQNTEPWKLLNHMPWNNIHTESHQSMREILNKQRFYYSTCSGFPGTPNLSLHSMNKGFQASGVLCCLDWSAQTHHPCWKKKPASSKHMYHWGSAVSFSYERVAGLIKEHLHKKTKQNKTILPTHSTTNN